ncbi:TolC family protein [candidate division KSB1 bacterium]
MKITTIRMREEYKMILKRTFKDLILITLLMIMFVPAGQTQQKIFLTFDEAVNIAFDRSYEVYKRRKDYKMHSLNVMAGRAALKSFSNFDMSAPSLRHEIEKKYDSGSQSYRFITSERTQVKASWNITQPIITDGKLSINSNIESLDQRGSDRQFRNGLSLRFEQPLFTRNKISKNVWKAELNYEKTELGSISSLLVHYQSLNRLYYDLYRDIEESKIETMIAEISNEALAEAQRKLSIGEIDSVEVLRLEVENLLNQSRQLDKDVAFYKKEMEFKQKFGLSFDQPIELVADLTIMEYDIDLDLAIERGMTNRPSIRQAEIDLAFSEDRINEASLRSEFKASVVATYGWENKTNPNLDESFTDMFSDYNVTRSLKFAVNFYLWDNGRKKYAVESAKINYENALLKFDNDVISRENEIRSAVRGVESSQSRAKRQQDNVDRARISYEQSLEKFKSGEISGQELSRTLEEYRNAQNLFLNSFISYQTSWINFQQKTYWDYENNMSLKEKFRKYLQSN